MSLGVNLWGQQSGQAVRRGKTGSLTYIVVRVGEVVMDIDACCLGRRGVGLGWVVGGHLGDQFSSPAIGLNLL
jgi:hypothetical protein